MADVPLQFQPGVGVKKVRAGDGMEIEDLRHGVVEFRSSGGGSFHGVAVRNADASDNSVIIDPVNFAPAFDTVDLDTDGYFDDPGDFYVTIPLGLGGLYQVYGFIHLDPSGVAPGASRRARISGSLTPLTSPYIPSNVVADMLPICGTGVFPEGAQVSIYVNDGRGDGIYWDAYLSLYLLTAL